MPESRGQACWLKGWCRLEKKAADGLLGGEAAASVEVRPCARIAIKALAS